MPISLTIIAMQAAVSSVAAAPSLPVLRNPASIIGPNDYPSASVAKVEVGIVSADIAVSENGKAIGCTVTETSGFPALDSATCRLFLARAQFDPAHAANGSAIAGSYRVATAWGIDTHQPRVSLGMPLQVSRIPADYRKPVAAKVAFDGTGRMISCEVTETSGSASADRATCAYLRSNLVTPPPRSGSAKVAPVAVRYVKANLVAAPTPVK